MSFGRAVPRCQKLDSSTLYRAVPPAFFYLKVSAIRAELSCRGKKPLSFPRQETKSAKRAMKTVLIIDDNHDYRETFREILEDNEVEVFESDCPDSAYELLSTIDPPDLIICDLHMPFTHKEDAGEYPISRDVGIKTAQELAWVYPNTSVIALTASDPSEMKQVKSDLAPIPAYPKPVHYKELVELIHCLLLCKDFGGLQ